MSYDMISSFIIIQIYALKIFSTVTHGFGPGSFPAGKTAGWKGGSGGGVCFVCTVVVQVRYGLARLPNSIVFDSVSF